MQLCSEGVFVGSGIFKFENPEKRAKAIIEATTYYNDSTILMEISEDLGEPISGLDLRDVADRYAERSWEI